jgi:hypothetical protein
LAQENSIRNVRVAYLALGIALCLGALAGCATSSTSDQVQDVGNGIYRVGVRTSALSDQPAAFGDAVRKAGEYCHAKGQKLQTVPDPGGSDVHFRCVSPAEAPSVEPDDEGGH